MAEVPFLPPGPSAEFLRRSAAALPNDELPVVPEGWGTGALESYDPATGQRERFATISPPVSVAVQYHQMMESLRQQANATKFKEQQKAYEAAVRFQHMREAQRMREAGATEKEILATLGPGLFYNNMSALAGMVREATPPPDPYLTNFGGADAIIYGKNKAVQFIPKSAQPPPPLPDNLKEIPIINADGTTNETDYAVPSANGKGLVVRRRAQKKDSVTPSARLAALKDQIEEDQKELASHILNTKEEKATQEFQQRTLELKQRIARKQAERAAVLEGIATGSPQSGRKAPPQSEAANEARELIKKHPAKADAIRARYRETYGVDL